ncbi:hypothetical protein [Streptomyces varsoviensis]|uniref:hypothetical protein n=1 Tax=Streptomyces varsoviensis TaxID=67373 RepID=UPI0006623D38|nr:hypothetical protein [Streptomyces varsoviensis]
MARHAPNTLLSALLVEADWTAGELARAVNSLAAAQGLTLRYDRTSVAHWLSGSRPRPPVPELVASAFGHRVRRVVTAEDTGLLRPGQAPPPRPPDRPAAADALRHLTALCRADVDPARRAVLTRTTVYAPSALALPGWRPRPPDRPRGPEARATSADALALQSMTETFALLAERHGGAHVRAALTAYLAEGAGRLLVAPAPCPVHRELLSGTVQLAHLLAVMTDDSGHHSLAQRYFHTALRLAQEAGNRRLYAVTLRAMSAQALNLGHPLHAQSLADTAVDAAGIDAGPATRSFLLSQRAHVYARQRQPRRALADLAAAERHHEQASSPPGPFTAYPRAGLDYQRAQVLRALDEPSQAVSALAASARHRAPGQRRAHVLTQARLAETLLSMGLVEASCSHWHAFLDEYPHLHSEQADRALGRLHEELRRFPRQRQATAVRRRALALVRPSPAP